MKQRKRRSPEVIARIAAARWAGAPTPEERFWAKVDRRGPTDCWLFISTAERKGYGVIWWGGKVQYAHRVSWLIAGNRLEPDRVIDHICRTLKCVNPAHLRLVTTNENVKVGVSVWAINARKTHCSKGHEYTAENCAYRQGPPGKTRHGYPSNAPRRARICLTCFPANWRYAVIERQPPPGSSKTWLGPAKFYLDSVLPKVR